MGKYYKHSIIGKGKRKYTIPPFWQTVVESYEPPPKILDIEVIKHPQRLYNPKLETPELNENQQQIPFINININRKGERDIYFKQLKWKNIRKFQEEIFAGPTGQLYGYKYNKRIMIKPEFYEAGEFTGDNFACICKDKKWGYISIIKVDTLFDTIEWDYYIYPCLEYAESVYDGKAKVIYKGKIYVVDFINNVMSAQIE